MDSFPSNWDRPLEKPLGMGKLVTIHRLVTEGYDPPYQLPIHYGEEMKKKLVKRKAKKRRTLYDSASPGLKAILDCVSAEVATWEPWQRSTL